MCMSFHVDQSKHSWKTKYPYTKETYTPTIDFGCCLPNEIVQTIDFGVKSPKWNCPNELWRLERVTRRTLEVSARLFSRVPKKPIAAGVKEKAHGLVPCTYLLLFPLPSDNVQHDLQHWSLINFPKEVVFWSDTPTPMNWHYSLWRDKEVPREWLGYTGNFPILLQRQYYTAWSSCSAGTKSTAVALRIAASVQMAESSQTWLSR